MHISHKKNPIKVSAVRQRAAESSSVARVRPAVQLRAERREEPQPNERGSQRAELLDFRLRGQEVEAAGEEAQLKWGESLQGERA